MAAAATTGVRHNEEARSCNFRLEKCEVCAAERAKYTCPKCELRTCSLGCARIHKKELECDGIRDKTKFIPLHAFTDVHLLSDYRLLEEVGRSVDRLRRTLPRRCPRSNDLPVPLQRLRGAARASGVDLRFLPQNFTRRGANATFFNWKTRRLFWSIDWIFPQADNFKWMSLGVEEHAALSDVLRSILEPADAEEEIFGVRDAAARQILKDKLIFYRSAGTSALRILLKAEKVEKSGRKFHELDITRTLRENLSKKTIVEFPTIHVVFKDRSDAYELVDSDEDERAEKSVSRNGDGTDTSCPRVGAKGKAAPNYFFNAESTDSEEEETTSARDRPTRTALDRL